MEELSSKIRNEEVRKLFVQLSEEIEKTWESMDDCICTIED